MITLSAKIHLGESRTLEIDKNTLTSLSGKIFDRERIDLPNWGIISNDGKLGFYDSNFEVLNMIENGTLNTNSKAELFINNTLSNKTVKIGDYVTRDWNYDNDNRVVNISLQDDLIEWQDIAFGAWNMERSKTFKYVYDLLKKTTPQKWNIVADSSTEDFLSSVAVSTFYFEKGSLWAQWEKFCNAAMLHIYKDNKGDVIVKHGI